MVEARDPYTGGHLWRVSQFSMLLAKTIGCSRFQIAKIGLGGFLHDLGKIGIPDFILNKPDKLTDDKYAVIKTHPRLGSDPLSSHPLRDIAHDAIYLHHETPDGKGYPTGLIGDKIPLEARIIGHTEPLIPIQNCVGCGPTIVVTRKHKDGDKVFCRACGGGTVVQRKGNDIALLSLGKRGSADDLSVVMDDGLIQALVDSQFKDLVES